MRKSDNLCSDESGGLVAKEGLAQQADLDLDEVMADADLDEPG